MSQFPVIELRDVRFRWSSRSSFAISVPELQIEQGETVLLLGESGSGKSTLLSLMCGTVLADSGEINVGGTNLNSLSGWARDRFRAEQIGIIFQQFNLLPFGTVLDNILLPLKFAPKRRARCPDAAAKAVEMCKMLGLPEGVEKSKAANLSVGQQQRVAVVRALIGEPPILIADEPTSSLDETSQENFLDLLFAQVAAQKSTLLMVSHDPRLASRFDRVVHMKDVVSVEGRQA
ncbi:ABC transporter ATP-binding protein [Halocynthiibacter sp. C4]|uniref:ABC transporter ATP-binding protein n=1 Tax=Halocynthiibacter sp. C4 TaxID=2992758 RepID=UPI00237A9F22|nr:ABC transporter ATP-binding protein [Halocynthiibacter sp. C4]MDE0588555.1 ABC transporter ATP-binding protein [Halocynthiibacter sp. C4]